MPEFVTAGSKSQITEGAPFCAKIHGKEIALINFGGEIYALDNTCTHAGGPLCEGTQDGRVIECPWHGSRFDVETGALVGPPAADPVRTYEVRVDGDDVMIKI